MTSRGGNQRAIGSAGRVIGEDHGRAVLTDHEVELMRAIHEEYPVGHPQHVGYTRLARMFEVSRTQAMRVCRYIDRAHTTVRFKQSR